MLTAAFQFIALSVILMRPEFGWRDGVFSMLNAAVMSLGVSTVFCLPAVIRVTAVGPLKVYFISYILGFFTVALILEGLTTTVLGSPREESYRLSFTETLQGAILLTILAAPLGALSTAAFGVLSWLIPSVRTRHG